MKILRKSLIIKLLLLNAIIVGCSITKNSTDVEQLTFGNGGGFTGNVTEYILNPKGEIFKHEKLPKSETKIKKISKEKTFELFSKAKAVQLDTCKFIYPGNMYYFIKIKSNGKENYISWGDGKHKVNPEIESFYNEFINLLKN